MRDAHVRVANARPWHSAIRRDHEILVVLTDEQIRRARENVGADKIGAGRQFGAECFQFGDRVVALPARLCDVRERAIAVFVDRIADITGIQQIPVFSRAGPLQFVRSRSADANQSVDGVVQRATETVRQ